jgi:hypothetical protein
MLGLGQGTLDRNHVTFLLNFMSSPTLYTPPTPSPPARSLWHRLIYDALHSPSAGGGRKDEGGGGGGADGFEDCGRFFPPGVFDAGRPGRGGAQLPPGWEEASGACERAERAGGGFLAGPCMNAARSMRTCMV